MCTVLCIYDIIYILQETGGGGWEGKSRKGRHVASPPTFEIMVAPLVIIKYRAQNSHFERGRSRQPIRVKLLRHGMCARTITDSRRLRTVHAHGEYSYRLRIVVRRTWTLTFR